MGGPTEREEPPFYERHGFRVVSDEVPLRDGPACGGMRRHAHPELGAGEGVQELVQPVLVPDVEPDPGDLPVACVHDDHELPRVGAAARVPGDVEELHGVVVGAECVVELAGDRAVLAKEWPELCQELLEAPVVAGEWVPARDNAGRNRPRTSRPGPPCLRR